jgi:hypothetical protein
VRSDKAEVNNGDRGEVGCTGGWRRTGGGSAQGVTSSCHPIGKYDVVARCQLSNGGSSIGCLICE